jgi:GT2 family glycosyltransferase
MTNNIDLSICIVNWNGKEVLKKCLLSIDQHKEDLIVEIIIVDNASSDNSVEMIEKEFPEAILIKSDTNLGYGKANNIAIKRSRGKNILILNPDILIREPIFREMIQYLKCHPDVGCVGCKLINIDGSIQKSYHKSFPTPYSEFKQGMLINRLYDIIPRRNGKSQGNIKVSWLVGACMMFRNEVLETLGGFDDMYFMYGEDIDLCYRIYQLGYKIIYLDSLKMTHYHAFASGKKKKKYFSAVLQRESIYRFMKAHYNSISVVLYRLVWILSGIFRVVLLLPSYIIFKITKNDVENLGLTIEKYYRIVSWSLGKEEWTRYKIPD